MTTTTTNTPNKMSNQKNHSSPFPSCFFPTATATATATAAANNHSTAAPPISGNPNLTTCLYHTDLGLFSLTWSRNLVGRSLHLNLLPAAADDDGSPLSPPPPPSLSTPTFHLQIKPFIFWNKSGSKKLNLTTANANAKSQKPIQIYWDLSRAKFGSGPEPQSGFYIAVVSGGEMALLVGDSDKEAYARSKSKPSNPRKTQTMVLRREHVYGNKLYTTKATFGGTDREITIDCRLGGDDPRLCFSVDRKRVLQIKHLKWKFRGNERVEAGGGAQIQISWDVYNWLFDEESPSSAADQDQDGYALFVFKFERPGSGPEHEECDEAAAGQLNWGPPPHQQSCGFGFEKKRMRRGLLRSSRSSSSSSLSSASSSCSSVMEWASMEENELKGPSGFSLLVYAWKR